MVFDITVMLMRREGLQQAYSRISYTDPKWGGGSWPPQFFILLLLLLLEALQTLTSDSLPPFRTVSGDSLHALRCVRKISQLVSHWMDFSEI